MNKLDPRPKHVLDRNGRISRRRVGLFGAVPDDLDVWWSQIQAAALAEGLDPGTRADWMAPNQRTASRRPVGANMGGPRPPYVPPQNPSARRAAELAKAKRTPPAEDPA